MVNTMRTYFVAHCGRRRLTLLFTVSTGLSGRGVLTRDRLLVRDGMSLRFRRCLRTGLVVEILCVPNLADRMRNC